MIELFDYPPTPVIVMPGVGCDKVLTHIEVADHYGLVVVHLAPRWRIIVSKDHSQWILQRRNAETLNKGLWIGQSYFTTRKGLIAICSERRLLSDPKARALLKALPAQISEYRK